MKPWMQGCPTGTVKGCVRGRNAVATCCTNDLPVYVLGQNQALALLLVCMT